MKKKINLKNLRKKKAADELETLFDQFEEEFRTCEAKMSQLKQTIVDHQATNPTDEEQKDHMRADEEIKPAG